MEKEAFEACDIAIEALKLMNPDYENDQKEQ